MNGKKSLYNCNIFTHGRSNRVILRKEYTQFVGSHFSNVTIFKMIITT